MSQEEKLEEAISQLKNKGYRITVQLLEDMELIRKSWSYELEESGSDYDAIDVIKKRRER